MNIIILEDSLKAGFGGGQRITLDVIRVLMKDFDVYVFDTNTSSVFNKKLKDIDIKSIKLECYGKASKFFFLIFIDRIVSFFYVLKNLFLINGFLKEKNISNKSLVYAATKNGLVLSFMLKVIYNIDYIYHAHMIESKITEKLVSLLTKKAHKVICVSQKVKDQFKSQNTVIVSNSIEMLTDEYKTIKHKKKFIVATISTLNHIKGIEYFVKSYSFLENKNIIYHIYGEGPLKITLDYNSGDILFKGHVLDAQEILLRDIDILVVPTIIQESFGMVILEAFSCGVPVVTTNIGMQKVHIENSQAGELVSIKNPKEIAEKIEYILSCEDRYRLYSQKGLNYAKEFDNIVFKKRIMEIFKNYDFTSK